MSATPAASAAFGHAVRVGAPNIPDRDRVLDRIAGALSRRTLSNNGPLVREFEDRLRRLTGARHCIAVTNGTVALELAVRACGLTGEVIVPSFTYVATPHALSWQGLTPVFGDVDAYGCLDPDHVRRLVTPRTSGIVGVHLLGTCCDAAGLEAVAAELGLVLLFDAAHALGSATDGRRVGTLGRAEIFSFHATKFVNSFEGGAVATDDDELAARVRAMRNFGQDDDGVVRSLGTNAKMHEISAAMGLTAVENITGLIAGNEQRHTWYADGLRDLPGIAVRGPRPADASNYSYLSVLVDPARAGVTRDEIVRRLAEENVFAKVYFHPGNHRLEPYPQERHRPLPLPRSERLAEQILVLPNSADLTADDVGLICRLIRDLVTRATGARGEPTSRPTVSVRARESS
ncbi:DegT/DnrJ/EryC1/StrS family aminotransferase [Actinoplanes sp. NPDC048791]|uniref:DegT/DnrJ/EryC1/StrS family aminotransferase n=1 Tax=Actinoplanes sp. NPDC048791 TaxID=3154623 RepID=UPI00340041AB